MMMAGYGRPQLRQDESQSGTKSTQPEPGPRGNQAGKQKVQVQVTAPGHRMGKLSQKGWFEALAPGDPLGIANLTSEP